MVKFAVVKSSQLAKYNRWDAAFHIALNDVRDRVDFLRAAMDPDEAAARLKEIPLSAKAPLLVLCRGNHPRLNAANIDSVIKEYPHLALALMEQNAEPAIKLVREQIVCDQAALQALLEMTALDTVAQARVAAPASDADKADSPQDFQAGWIYPLKDPAAYDDDYGRGYDHAAIAHDAEPGGCWLHDAWIVNSVGEPHPGYDAVPVPVRLEDVDVSAGRPFDGSLPQPKSIFDGPWGKR